MPDAPAIRRLGPEDLDSAAELHERFIPRRGSKQLLEWEFFDPLLPKPGILLGAFDGARLIGTQGYIPFRAWHAGEDLLSAKSELTLLDPEYRGRGIFNLLYEAGFEQCAEAGIGCIWGFTPAVKPFAKVGFALPGTLTVEDLLFKPLRTVLSARRGGAAPASDPRPFSALPDAAQGAFGLRRDEAYLEHRYAANPLRRVVHFDDEAGLLYSSGGERPFTYVSEVADQDLLEESVARALRTREGRRWLAVRRICTTPRLGWRSARVAVHRVRETPLHIVFKWLGARADDPPPPFEVEEGYMEGTE